MTKLHSDWEIPEHQTVLFGPRKSRYVVVIPVINEGERIHAQLGKMQASGLLAEYDTVLADGGSTDGSTDENMLAELGMRALLIKTAAGKLSAQLRMAYAWALLEGYEGIITIDGNDKDSVESIPEFSAALDGGVDYAQASRFLRQGKGINTPILRLMAIRLIHAPVLSLAARHWLTDTTQGFRAYSRRYLTDPRVAPFRDVFQDYELLAYLSVRASQLDMNVKEIPTTRSYPKGQKVPTKISSVKGYRDLLVVLWRTLTRQYHPRN